MLGGMDATGRPDGLQAWTELSEATAMVRSAVNRALIQGAGLSLAENLVLCHVAMAPDGRLRMVEIADQLGLAKSAVTKTVDRLEGRGWVARRRNEEDRRTVHATLTPAGAEMFRRAQPVFVSAVSGQLCGPLSPAELAQLRTLLAKLLSTSASRSRQARIQSR
jgi:DNA-binding MarR family transcriptional regulator